MQVKIIAMIITSAVTATLNPRIVAMVVPKPEVVRTANGESGEIARARTMGRRGLNVRIPVTIVTRSRIV